MDTDSQLLADAGLPVFKFLLTQPASFSLSSLFAKKPSKVIRMFAKDAVGFSVSNPKGKNKRWKTKSSSTYHQELDMETTWPTSSQWLSLVCPNLW